MTQESKPESVVIDFKRIRSRLKSEQGCVHGNYVYDEETRELFCTKCEKEVDKMEVMFRLISDLKRMKQKLSLHKVEMEKIEKRKRVKCQHCNQFTRLNLNLTWSDRYKYNNEGEL